MWLTLVTAIVAVCALLANAIHNNRELLERKFQLRTPGEWEREWHQERFSRCRDSITRHLRWACEKDIYKVKSADINEVKRADGELLANTGDAGDDFDDDEEPSSEDGGAFRRNNLVEEDYRYPWTSEAETRSMLRVKRGRAKRHITQECCSAKGCTWEEYAEYCTQNSRRDWRTVTITE